MVELRHLRYFLAVAEELHFGRAAERLHMAQPPLSQQIRQLETELGFQLFHRTRRQVELTAAGHCFLEDCQAILQRLDRAILRGQQVSRGELGRSLTHEPFILFPRPLAPGLYDQIISLCQQATFSPNVVQEAVQMQTIISLVAAEIGLAIVPQSLENLQRTGVVYRPLDEPTPQAAIALIWQQQRRSPTRDRFLEIVQTLLSTEP
ncbi:LysR family transcriptional regulator [Vacuolonema iberomarrocanum]|uniref:LysR family transcriptional regulator n=1 Tax=Vacuolonema iberomarrocanum TaxID=3454632 RepID=UPI001A01AE3E|nr:LysR family transcriptional regulator [filamentous cyanobacterium LEGE 07170]